MADRQNSTDLTSFGVCFFPTQSVRQVAGVARLCDELGYGFFGIGDVHELWADVYVSLALAADSTRTIKLGTWVTNPLTRHPTVTANAICTLNDATDGRAFLGIGVGDGAVRLIDNHPATLEQLASAISLIRNRIQAPRNGMKRASVPVYWAAAGDKSTREGARHADGVIVSGWNIPELLRESIEIISEGAAVQHRLVAPIFNTGFVVDNDGSQARRLAKPYVARALARPSSAKVSGWSAKDSKQLAEAYNFQHHFRSDHEIAELVPDELVSKKAIAGTPAECAVQIRQILDAGFERIAVIPFGDIPTTLRRLAREVAPLVCGDA